MTQSFEILDRTLQASEIRTPLGQELLRDARLLREHATCTCSVATLRMAIKSLHKNYFLARFPATGEHHDPCCPSYQPPGIGTERRSTLKGVRAIVEDDGKAWVRLNVPLTQPEAGGATTGIGSRKGTGGRARSASTSLTALGHYLLDRGGLTSMVAGLHPGHWSASTSAIAANLANIWISGDQGNLAVIPGGGKYGRTAIHGEASSIVPVVIREGTTVNAGQSTMQQLSLGGS